MAKCNPGLQRIVFDCEGLGYLPVNDRPPLANLICDPSLSHNSIFVWPDLQYLVIRPLDTWWKSSQGVELLAKFLAAHSKLETLRIFEYFGPNPPSPLTPPFSLAPYPDSLPSLKKLMGSARLIAGVLESRGACSSVQVVVQNELPEQEQNGWAHVQRAIHALEKAPGNQIRRLSLQAPRFNHELYSKLAQLAPGIQFLELFPDMNDPVTPDAEFEAVVVSRCSSPTSVLLTDSQLDQNHCRIKQVHESQHHWSPHGGQLCQFIRQRGRRLVRTSKATSSTKFYSLWSRSTSDVRP